MSTNLANAADDFAKEADELERLLAPADYVRGIRACVTALRERAAMDAANEGDS
jgi:hypothetical protein